MKYTRGKNPNSRNVKKGEKLSEEVKLKISRSHIGIKHNQQTKDKLSLFHKGKKLSQETKNKISEVAKEKRFGSWMTGKKHSKETREKMSILHKKRVSLGLNNFYIDGRTPKNTKIRHSLEYKLWRESVFKRDNYTCVWCEKHGGNLEADHIKPFALFPELRFAIDNGRTLCVECHRKTDTFGWKAKQGEMSERIAGVETAIKFLTK